MKILHYSLGLPGFRSGGLTKYSIDLMKEEVELGNDISLLYPGAFKFKNKTYIKLDGCYEKIRIFELINPLPVSLVDGVKEPSYYYSTKPSMKEYFKEWLSENNFEALHVHTLMGLPIEFIDAAKSLKIKILYTTHDYYGLCPKINLVRASGVICDDNTNYIECYNCCRDGLSLKKIKIMQSRLYRCVKNTKYGRAKITNVKKILIRKNKKLDIKSNNLSKNELLEIGKKYDNLRKYYYEIFNKFDYFHFNSSITKSVFERYIAGLRGEVISITHSDISDNRVIKNYNHKRLRIVFLGSDAMHKGLNNLIMSLDKLGEELKDYWQLYVWGVDGTNDSENIEYKGRYNYKSMSEIFSNADLIVIPSIWHETFGFIGLEAYSYGVPVLLTDLVGFSDLIKNDLNGFIVKPNIDSLYSKILSLIKDREQLKNVNENIYSEKFSLQMEEHTKKILDLYKRI